MRKVSSWRMGKREISSAKKDPSLKSDSAHLVKIFLAFYGTRKFIIAFAGSYPQSDESSQHLHIPYFNFILPSAPRLSKQPPFQVFRIKKFCMHFLPVVYWYMSHPSRHHWFVQPYDRSIYWRVQMNYTLCNFLYFSATSSPLGPGIISTLLWMAINQCSSFGVWDKVSHTKKNKGQIILKFKFLDMRQEDERLNGSKHSPNWTCS
jgi:hypothetical protein